MFDLCEKGTCKKIFVFEKMLLALIAGTECLASTLVYLYTYIKVINVIGSTH